MDSLLSLLNEYELFNNIFPFKNLHSYTLIKLDKVENELNRIFKNLHSYTLTCYLKLNLQCLCNLKTYIVTL